MSAITVAMTFIARTRFNRDTRISFVLRLFCPLLTRWSSVIFLFHCLLFLFSLFSLAFYMILLFAWVCLFTLHHHLHIYPPGICCLFDPSCFILFSSTLCNYFFAAFRFQLIHCLLPLIFVNSHVIICYTKFALYSIIAVFPFTPNFCPFS